MYMWYVKLTHAINKGRVNFVNMRILGITIPDEKRLEIGLTSIYGIGRSRAQKILDSAKIPYGLKPPEVNQSQENEIRKNVEKFKLEGDLKRDISSNIKRLKDIKTYRGLRHNKSVPVRGQRSKTNSRTRRGNIRRTMGTGRRAIEKK